MNKRSSLIATTVLCLSPDACASNPSNSQIGADNGAVVGGLVGFARTGRSAAVTVLGAGAAAGHEIGKRMK